MDKQELKKIEIEKGTEKLVKSNQILTETCGKSIKIEK